MEITTANEEQDGQQLSGGTDQIEKGSGYGDPGQGSGVTVPADDEATSNGTGGSEEDRAASLPGTTAGETVTENDSENAGAGIDYGGIGDDAGAITENIEGAPEDSVG